MLQLRNNGNEFNIGSTFDSSFILTLSNGGNAELYQGGNIYTPTSINENDKQFAIVDTGQYFIKLDKTLYPLFKVDYQEDVELVSVRMTASAGYANYFQPSTQRIQGSYLQTSWIKTEEYNTDGRVAIYIDTRNDTSQLDVSLNRVNLKGQYRLVERTSTHIVLGVYIEEDINEDTQFYFKIGNTLVIFANILKKG